MIQLVYKDKFYVAGKSVEVRKQLEILSLQYKTVKDFLTYKTKDL